MMRAVSGGGHLGARRPPPDGGGRGARVFDREKVSLACGTALELASKPASKLAPPRGFC